MTVDLSESTDKKSVQKTAVKKSSISKTVDQKNTMQKVTDEKSNLKCRESIMQQKKLSFLLR